MHRVLEISDIVHLICALAKPSDLANLARTCSFLFPPATRELYEYSDYHQLLHLLRVCGEYGKEPPTEEGAERLRNVARAAARFDRYGGYIRHLSLSGAWWLAIPEGHNGSDTDIMRLIRIFHKLGPLAEASSSQPILPNLRTFKLVPQYWRHIEHVMPFFRGDLPYLEGFTIQLGNTTNGNDLASLLSILPATAPDLRHISLAGALPHPKELESSFSRLVGRLPSLESFEGGPASFGAGVFQNLDHCSRLGTFILRAGIYDDDVISSPFLEQPGISPTHFKALRKLEIKARPTELTTYILERMDPDRLDSLTVWLSGQDGLSLHEDVGRPISAILRFSEITNLDLRLHGQFKNEIEPRFWEEIRPLFTLRDLQQLDLFISIPLCKQAVDDSIVESMASAWPRLRRFALMWSDDDHSPGPTFQSLVALTKYCREIEIIQLQSIRAPAGLMPQPTGIGDVQPLHLRVRRYIIDNIDEAAAFLAKITSSLIVSRISVFSKAYFWLDEFDEDGVWSSVISKMHALRRDLTTIAHRDDVSLDGLDKYLGIVDFP